MSFIVLKGGSAGALALVVGVLLLTAAPAALAQRAPLACGKPPVECKTGSQCVRGKCVQPFMYHDQKACEDDIKRACKYYPGAGWHDAT
jgi:hypothetical protein